MAMSELLIAMFCNQELLLDSQTNFHCNLFCGSVFLFFLEKIGFFMKGGGHIA